MESLVGSNIMKLFYFLYIAAFHMAHAHYFSSLSLSMHRHRSA